jgi:hypothetical protein
MVHIPQALILIAFSFGAAIFHSLLGVERTVWSIATSETSLVEDRDLRFVRQALYGLSSYLPPSNGIVILVGVTGLIWQGVALHWTWPATVVFAAWLIGQIYILTFGRIVQAVGDLRRTDTASPIADVRRAVRQLIRQHFNGYLHAATMVVLELALIMLK